VRGLTPAEAGPDPPRHSGCCGRAGCPQDAVAVAPLLRQSRPQAHPRRSKVSVGTARSGTRRPEKTSACSQHRLLEVR
jgi:hypothetical protein